MSLTGSVLVVVVVELNLVIGVSLTSFAAIAMLDVVDSVWVVGCGSLSSLTAIAMLDIALADEFGFAASLCECTVDGCTSLWSLIAEAVVIVVLAELAVAVVVEVVELAVVVLVCCA